MSETTQTTHTNPLPSLSVRWHFFSDPTFPELQYYMLPFMASTELEMCGSGVTIAKVVKLQEGNQAESNY